MKIGWIGLGNMGIPMAGNLLKAGYELSVYNRTKEKSKALLEQGASFAESPSQLLQDCDVVISMLADDQAVKEVYLGAGGLLAHPVADKKILIDMSTVSPSTSRQLYEACNNAGISFLDAPVSGSVQPAKEGKLVIMVGGDQESYEKVKPIFDVLGKLSLYLGQPGSGSSAKLAINLLLGITVQGIAESVLFANQLGIKTEDILTIINESAVGTAISRLKSSSILQGEYPAAFALKHMAKDLRLANDAVHLTPAADAVYRTYQTALREGLGELDVMAIMKHLEKRE